MARKKTPDEAPVTDDQVAVKLPGGGTLTLGPEKRWQPSGGADTEAVAVAQEIADNYEYNPGEGYPGYRLAQIVADALGGEAVLPPREPGKKGTVY